MDPETIRTCQQIIGYEFSDPSLLKRALTHSSVAPTRPESNERLEFLGDAVLGLVVCHELYLQYPDLMEGEMTRIKSQVVSRETCADITVEMGIGELLQLGKSVHHPVGLPISISADVFEAIIGAIYLDGGLEPAREFILSRLRVKIADAFDEGQQRNYKSLLQQHVQRHWATTPEYLLLDEKGPDHSKCFEVAVCIDGRHFTSAWGMNKKEAEQKAAYLSLLELGVLSEQNPNPPQEQAVPE